MIDARETALSEARSHDDSRREARLRYYLGREGNMLKKDRARSWSFDHQGGYMIVDAARNFIVAGQRFDLTLDDAENWLIELGRNPGEVRRKLREAVENASRE